MHSFKVPEDKDFDDEIKLPLMSHLKNIGCGATGLTEPKYETFKSSQFFVTQSIGCTCNNGNPKT